jgi:hypothetical protein
MHVSFGHHLSFSPLAHRRTFSEGETPYRFISCGFTKSRLNAISEAKGYYGISSNVTFQKQYSPKCFIIINIAPSSRYPLLSAYHAHWVIPAPRRDNGYELAVKWPTYTGPPFPLGKRKGHVLKGVEKRHAKILASSSPKPLYTWPYPAFPVLTTTLV